MRTTQRRRRSVRRPGAALIEFSLVAPILFVFVLAAVEFGRINMIRHTVDNAAYEAARRGVASGATSSQIQTTATNVLNAVQVRGAKITVQPDVITSSTPSVTVTIDVPFAPNNWVAPLFFSSANLTSSCTLGRDVP